MGLGRGMGKGCRGIIKIPDTAPEMSFGANSNNLFELAWQGQPTSGDINTLVNGGYLSFTGTITAEYYSGYWQFTITSGAKIVVKQFRKLTRLKLYSATQCTWAYNKAMPKTLTFLSLNGNTIYWTYTGALPAGLTRVDLNGSNIKWIWNGNLPTGLTYLCLWGANIRWDYEGALPTGLSDRLYLSGANINWTGWGVQASFSFDAKVLISGSYYINIGNSPASEAETANFLSKIDAVALDCASNPQTLTFKKTTNITSEEYLPILQSLTNKHYTIVLGS
jgi:hypothetical protein